MDFQWYEWYCFEHVAGPLFVGHLIAMLMYIPIYFIADRYLKRRL